MRRTDSLLSVAVALVAQPDARHWGYDLSKASGLRSGVLYPILHRLYDQGWLDDGWEEHDSTRKRPPRRYYKLTDVGKRELGALAEAAATPRAARRSTPQPGWAS